MPEGSQDRSALAGRQLGQAHALAPTGAEEFGPTGGPRILHPRQALAGHDVPDAVERDQRYRSAPHAAGLASGHRQDVLGADPQAEAQDEQVEAAGRSQPPGKCSGSPWGSEIQIRSCGESVVLVDQAAEQVLSGERLEGSPA